MLVNARSGTFLGRATLWGCAHVRVHPLQLPEEQRLAHVVYVDRIAACKIRNGAGDAQDPPAGARREVEALGGELQQVAGLAIGRGMALRIGRGATDPV